MPNLINAGLSALQHLWSGSARTAAPASPASAGDAAHAPGETEPLLSPRSSLSSGPPAPRNAIASRLGGIVPAVSSAMDTAMRATAQTFDACCGGSDAASIADETPASENEAPPAGATGVVLGATAALQGPDPGFIVIRQQGEPVLAAPTVERPWYDVLGVNAPWLQRERIAEDCATMPDSQQVIRGALQRLSLEVEDRIHARRDPASGEIPAEVQAARDIFLNNRNQALAVLDAFAELGLPPLQSPNTIGADWVTLRGRSSALSASLDRFKTELDKRVAALTELHQGTLPDELWSAETTCVRLHKQVSRVIAAYERVGIQEPWLAPPERDLRCVTMAGIKNLQEKLQQVDESLVRAREEAQRADHSLALPLQQAISVCERLRDETAAAVKAHESYLLEAPPVDPDAEVDPRDEGLLAFETETARVNFKKFLVRGTPVAHVSKGLMESDVGPSLGGGVVSGFESVAETLKNPWHVERYARSTRSFFRSMKREARARGSSPPMDSFLRPSKVIRNVEATPHVYIRNGVAVGLQPTSGLYFLEHVPAVLRVHNPNPSTLQGLADAAHVNDRFQQVHGRPLSPKAFGLLSYIACYTRWSNTDGDPTSAHSKIWTMSRKSFSSMYSSSLKNKHDRDDIRWLLNPEFGNGCPPMMGMLGYTPEDRVYKNGYLVPPPATDNPERMPVQPALADGPRLMDWLVSIYNPAAFGRDTDLLSPPDGHDRRAKKQHGMGNLGDVNKVTGELIVEDRGDVQRPAIFPASALPAACMLEYIKWAEYNPRIARLDPVVRDPSEKQESMRIFRELSKLFIDLSDFAADMHFDRPLDKDILEGAKRQLTNSHEIFKRSLDDPEIGARCEVLLKAVSTLNPGDPPDQALGRTAEELVHQLDEAFPRFMETLFAPEFEVWNKWLQENPPSTRPSSSGSEGAQEGVGLRPEILSGRAPRAGAS